MTGGVDPGCQAGDDHVTRCCCAASNLLRRSEAIVRSIPATDYRERRHRRLNRITLDKQKSRPSVKVSET
jgi:hypothetical protein